MMYDVNVKALDTLLSKIAGPAMILRAMSFIFLYKINEDSNENDASIDNVKMNNIGESKPSNIRVNGSKAYATYSNLYFKGATLRASCKA